jgi:hypothetical protein
VQVFLVKKLIKRIMLTMCLWSVSGIAFSDSNSEKLRYMSMLIRDRLPSIQESKDFYENKKSLDEFINTWMASADHEKRMNRYFDDMFGMEKYIFISQSNFILARYHTENSNVPQSVPADLDAYGSKTNVYYLPDYEVSDCFKSGATAPVLMDVWWSDTQQLICPTAISPNGVAGSFMKLTSTDNILHFTDSAGTFAATIPATIYTDLTALAAAIQTQMNIESTNTYDVSVASSYFLEFAVDSGNVTIDYSGANSITGILGSGLTGTSSTNTAVYSGYAPNNKRCLSSGSDGMADEDCGCGEKLFLCYPAEDLGKVMSAVGNEFQSRATHFYDASGSWNDVFGGSKFYGNRLLYHHYLFQQEINITSLVPPAGIVADVMALSPTVSSEVPMPEYSSIRQGSDGVERSGVVTSPAFLRRFNNMRSRIRAVVERMLCRDVDGSLNVDNTNTFYNDNFSASATQDIGIAVNAHGHKDGCKDCHYSLDNYASTILTWADGGLGNWGEYVWNEKTQVGHVLGQTGTGPRFLMNTMMENQAGGFYECMAKRAYEDFTGGNWASLSSADRTSFETSAQQGPKQTISAILTSDVVKNMRSNAPTVTSTTTTITYAFNNDIKPILEDKCGGSSCHSADGNQTKYNTSKAIFDTAPAIRISNGSMPPSGSTALTEAEKDILLIYLAQ